MHLKLQQELLGEILPYASGSYLKLQKAELGKIFSVACQLLGIAKASTGGLSTTSKMPCKSYSLPAPKCITGAKLREVPGSTCNKCYAFKGNYLFPVVKNALMRRFDALQAALADKKQAEKWISGMIFLINRYSEKYFRWHDSGDLQSEGHLQLICEVAKQTPKTKHWLPTREYSIVNCYLGEIPNNLLIRVSAHMIDSLFPPATRFTTSTVNSEMPAYGKQCRANTRDGHCGLCRACWKPEVSNVSYPLH